MTFSQLNAGATIQRIGEEIYVDDKQTRKMGVRTITEFRVRRGREKTALWVSSAQVQQWLDTAQGIENPLD